MKALKNKDFGKYMLQASGQVLIIIIGIIVALNINNWNERKNKNILEIKTLYEIKKGFEDDLIDINANINIQQSAIKSGNVLLTHLRNESPMDDSLKFHFANCGMFTIFIARTAPFETLKTRGLDIISNDSIRIQIAKIHDSNYEAIIAFQNRFNNNLRNYINFLQSNFSDIDFSQSATPINYNQLLQNNEFINLIDLNTQSKIFSIYYYRLTKTQIIELIKNIDQELEHLEAQ